MMADINDGNEGTKGSGINQGNNTSPKGSTPVPDPTALTTEALRREVAALKELIDQRLSAAEVLGDTKIQLGREGGQGLKELLESQIQEIKATANVAHTDIREYIRERANSASELLDEKFEGRDKALVAALQAAKEAVEKANAATEKRFDNVQELLAQLGQAQGLLLPRAEAESRIGDLDRRVGELKSTVDTRGGVTEGGLGSTANARANIGVWVALAGMALTMIIVFVAVMNLATGRP